MNWIINYTFVINSSLLLNYGFNPDDKVEVLFSKSDNCFFITKTNLGSNKLCRDTGNSITLKTRNRFVAEKLGAEPNQRLYFDIIQDEQDKKYNSVRCIIKKQENE